MLALSALKDFKVLIGTPCYGGATSALYSVALHRLTAQAVHAGMDILLDTNSTSDVFSARNKMVSKLLAMPELTHLLFWDADIGCDPERVFRLLLADRDVAVGVYPIKQEGMPYPFFPLENQTDQYGFVRVEKATTGFMCIKRHVIEKMVKAYPDKYYIETDWDGVESEPIWDFFDPVVVNHRRMTEDYSFCKLWRDLGGEVLVDFYSKLDHLGQTIFRGDLASAYPAKAQEAA